MPPADQRAFQIPDKATEAVRTLVKAANDAVASDGVSDCINTHAHGRTLPPSSYSLRPLVAYFLYYLKTCMGD